MILPMHMPLEHCCAKIRKRIPRTKTARPSKSSVFSLRSRPQVPEAFQKLSLAWKIPPVNSGGFLLSPLGTSCKPSFCPIRKHPQLINGILFVKGISSNLSITKALYPLRYKAFMLAAGEGFEPSQTESESVVLPLHNPAISAPALAEANIIISPKSHLSRKNPKLFPFFQVSV